MSNASILEEYALVFDFDGVILDSAIIKRQAFADLYADYPAHDYQAIVAYLSRRGGQPREVKFHHIEEHILGRSVNNQGIQTLCDRFKENVEQKLMMAPTIPGAIEFLRHWHMSRSLFLLSATPQYELDDIVQSRGLATYFKAVIGAPPDKSTGLRNLLARHHFDAQRAIMIGDSYNDYRAARSNGTLFIGVMADCNISPFPADIITVPNLLVLEHALTRLLKH